MFQCSWLYLYLHVQSWLYVSYMYTHIQCSYMYTHTHTVFMPMQYLCNVHANTSELCVVCMSWMYTHTHTFTHDGIVCRFFSRVALQRPPLWGLILDVPGAEGPGCLRLAESQTQASGPCCLSAGEWARCYRRQRATGSSSHIAGDLSVATDGFASPLWMFPRAWCGSQQGTGGLPLPPL